MHKKRIDNKQERERGRRETEREGRKNIPNKSAIVYRRSVSGGALRNIRV